MRDSMRQNNCEFVDKPSPRRYGAAEVCCVPLRALSEYRDLDMLVNRLDNIRYDDSPSTVELSAEIEQRVFDVYWTLADQPWLGDWFLSQVLNPNVLRYQREHGSRH